MKGKFTHQRSILPITQFSYHEMKISTPKYNVQVYKRHFCEIFSKICS